MQLLFYKPNTLYLLDLFYKPNTQYLLDLFYKPNVAALCYDLLLFLFSFVTDSPKTFVEGEV